MCCTSQDWKLRSIACGEKIPQLDHELAGSNEDDKAFSTGVRLLKIANMTLGEGTQMENEKSFYINGIRKGIPESWNDASNNQTTGKVGRLNDKPMHMKTFGLKECR